MAIGGYVAARLRVQHEMRLKGQLAWPEQPPRIDPQAELAVAKAIERQSKCDTKESF